ncbi:hypothetical protein [Streptomyces sp. NPDC058308]|uniref:hypothetical protein n=1 Tax=Streptomyces sp. NPDC058308 TaxID=3346440 RepID=UPI0036DFD149
MTPTDMGTETGPAHFPTGRRRRTLVTLPASAESVPQRPQDSPPHPHSPAHHQHQQQHQQQYAYQQPQQAYPQPSQAYQQPHQQQPYQQPHFQDPPIYGTLLRLWADRGRTLPGRHDPEWARLVAPPVNYGSFSASRDPRGDVR